MKKRIFIAILMFCGISLYSQNIIHSKLSRDTILIGDQIEWLTLISLPSEVEMRMDSLSNPIISGVELIEDFKLDTTKVKNEIFEIEKKTIITSFDSGSYVIPGKSIYFYKDGKLVDSITTSPIKLEVETIPIDTTTYQLAALKPQIRYPIQMKEIVPWVFLFLIICLLVYLISKFLKNRRLNRTIFGKPIVQDPPHIVALRSLEKIRNQQLWQNDKQKQFYTLVTDTLRQYIEGRYNFQAMEQTSKEILEALSKEKIEPREFEGVKELLHTSDLVKFAKYSATKEENENAIPAAVKFVNSTFIQEMEEEK